jgi:hypothetical protein
MDKIDVPSYVRASASLAGMPLAGESFAGTCAVVERLAEFAADLEAFELDDAVEIAGRFEP